MDIGRVLKFYRKEKNKTQEEVAEAIVSTSYLSRIENNKTTVDEETLALLFNRLGVDYYKILSNDKRISDLLALWEEPLLNNDIEGCKEIYEELQKMIHPITNIKLQTEYHVKRIRACIILKCYEDAAYSIRFLEEYYDSLSARNRFYYFKHVGNYYWVNQESDKAKEYLDKALLEYSQAHLNELEKADMYFLYSLILYVNQRETLSFSYGQESLRIFQNNYKREQCLKLHVQLGICYSRLGDIMSGLCEFQKAKSLAKELNDTYHLGVVEHNIANMYLRKRDRNNAMSHLKMAMSYKEKESISYFQSLSLLIYVCYQEGLLEECQEYLNSHLETAKGLPTDNVPMQERWWLYPFISEEEREWETYLKEEFLPTLNRRHFNTNYQQRYFKFLGEYYQEKGGYKKAAAYYKLAIESNNIDVY